VTQLVKRQADLESELDKKLKDLRDGHEQHCQQLASQHESKKQKLNDDYQRYVSAQVFLCQQFNTPTVLQFCSTFSQVRGEWPITSNACGV